VTDQLRKATAAYHRAQETVAKRRAELTEAIVEAHLANVRQTAIVEITGFTREHIRRIVRDAIEEAEVRGRPAPF
jgi:hypothetical protein